MYSYETIRWWERMRNQIWEIYVPNLINNEEEPQNDFHIVLRPIIEKMTVIGNFNIRFKAPSRIMDEEELYIFLRGECEKSIYGRRIAC
jgi:hypothetical protein